MEQKDAIFALSKAFADYIVTCYEPNMIEELIERRYGYLLSHERSAVQNALQTKIATKSSYMKILQKVQSCLEENNQVLIQGIVQFRLKEYMEHLTRMVDEEVQHYELQQEQDAFLLLLRNFVESQMPLYEMVQFIVRENGTVDLLDADGDVIVYGCRGDVLLDTLLTIAPRSIVMHHMELFLHEALLATIQRVFGGKISICNGCALCGKIIT